MEVIDSGEGHQRAMGADSTMDEADEKSDTGEAVGVGDGQAVVADQQRHVRFDLTRNRLIVIEPRSLTKSQQRARDAEQRQRKKAKRERLKRLRARNS
ncbi:BZIP domain-containing protein [Plasmodiophora brassicae]|uniref:Uncharacterized protein n=1 Tax=Plasmodiophora brassicae TaxID=37360 RepID=A0A0G4IZH1_PLABS|nr:hypothetical protein PBRA_001525 [Plasmodiophora brassicae]SPQ94029.1 unnamed protein product [Plasmodiophora brassicae]